MNEKVRKPNAHVKKAEYWYENVPGGPIPKGKRNYPRDLACIKRIHIGDQEDWENLCRDGWTHNDAAVRHFSRLRIPAFCSLVPKLIKIERTPEEVAASVKAIEAITASLSQSLNCRTKTVYKNGMPVEALNGKY
jgi:hypothetical protein